MDYQSSVSFKLKRFEDFQLIHFTINESILIPAMLAKLSPPDTFSNLGSQLGIILSGRGPIWLYGYLCHYYHPAPWVATHDPRLGGAVVVQSHIPGKNTGDLIKWNSI